MKDSIKNKIEKMYKNINNRSVELVFYDRSLKKSIGIRKPPSDLLRELDDEFCEKENK